MITAGFVTTYLNDAASGLMCVVNIDVPSMQEACDLFKQYYGEKWIAPEDEDLPDEIQSFADWCTQKGIQCQEIKMQSATLIHWSDNTLSWEH